jgi:hypothetical protein
MQHCSEGEMELRAGKGVVRNGGAHGGCFIGPSKETVAELMRGRPVECVPWHERWAAAWHGAAAHLAGVGKEKGERGGVGPVGLLGRLGEMGRMATGPVKGKKKYNSKIEIDFYV